jgi:hypothetical protein
LNRIETDSTNVAMICCINLSDFEQLAQRAEGRMPGVKGGVYTGDNGHFEPVYYAVSAKHSNFETGSDVSRQDVVIDLK